MTRSGDVDADVARVLEILDERSDLEKSSPITFYKPIGWQAAAHAAEEVERFVIGANGSGKTEFGAAEVVQLVTGQSEWWQGGPHEVWCSTTTLAKSAETQRPKVKKLLPPSLIADWLHERDATSESTLYLTNGWIIRFRASKQGLGAFESGAAALVWHDEQPAPDVYDECMMRIFRCRGRHLTTFTPTKGLTWKDAHERVYKHGWLRFIAKHPGAKWGTVAPGIFVATAATADNPHVPADRIEQIKEMCRHRPTMLRVRLYGEWLNISEDAIVPVDALRLWTVAPPYWRRKVGWIDPAATKRDVPTKTRESCEFAIACSGMSPEGGMHLIDYRHGRYDAHRRMQVSKEFIKAHGLRQVFVQDVTGDRLFAAHLNDILAREGWECIVRLFEYDGPIPSKEERADEFAGYVGADRVFIRPEHEEFREEAGVFPHGASDDLFDACMGSLMVLLKIPDASQIADAVAGQVRSKRDRRGSADEGTLYPSGRGGILNERL